MVGLRNLLAHMVWFFCLSSLNFEGIGFHFHPKQDSSIKFSYVAGILCSIRWYKWCGIFWFFAGNFCDLCSGAMKYTFNGILQQHDTVCMSLYKRAYPRTQVPNSWYLIMQWLFLHHINNNSYGCSWEWSSGSDCRFIFLISGKLQAVESHGFTATSPSVCALPSIYFYI
jgi:hypothetical protein